ncbi:Uncharacterised protein [Mycobacterium tuberculosis]|nr:Uncharacterised protein [Mycobacterium tuberculosis]
MTWCASSMPSSVTPIASANIATLGPQMLAVTPGKRIIDDDVSASPKPYKPSCGLFHGP